MAKHRPQPERRQPPRRAPAAIPSALTGLTGSDTPDTPDVPLTEEEQARYDELDAEHFPWYRDDEAADTETPAVSVPDEATAAEVDTVMAMTPESPEPPKPSDLPYAAEQTAHVRRWHHLIWELERQAKVGHGLAHDRELHADAARELRSLLGLGPTEALQFPAPPSPYPPTVNEPPIGWSLPTPGNSER